MSRPATESAMITTRRRMLATWRRTSPGSPVASRRRSIRCDACAGVIPVLSPHGTSVGDVNLGYVAIDGCALTTREPFSEGRHRRWNHHLIAGRGSMGRRIEQDVAELVRERSLGSRVLDDGHIA